MAVDACEELLQEVDITPFLLALCGHTRGLPHAPPSPGPLSPGPFSSSIEEGPEPRERAVLASESSIETEDLSEPEFQSARVPGNPDPGLEISLTDVCQLRGETHDALHNLIQVGSLVRVEEGWSPACTGRQCSLLGWGCVGICSRVAGSVLRSG